MHTSPADFPQTWQRPPFTDLLDCLKKLQVDPPVWNPSTSRKIALRDHENSATFRREVAAYLATIISSGLKWIESDDEKEAIWEEASRRLSERCGRAGMGEITRRWPFEGPAHPAFELTIREPPITGDDLGLKTWGSSYLLAQQLDKIASSSLSHLLASGNGGGGSAVNVLELGSGTGLLGMAAAVIWKTSVMLTDLPTIVPNLAYNVEANRSLIESHGGGVAAGALTWGGSGDEDSGQPEAFTKKNQFQIVLVADPLYDDNHPGLLSSAVKDHIRRDDAARVVVMVPKRDQATVGLLATFRSLLLQGEEPLVCLEEHTLAVQDDWEEDEDAPQVECWWGVFGKAPTPAS